MNSDQYELFEKTISQRFDDWIETDFGKWVAGNFIKEAYTWYVIRNKLVGPRFIWERLRWILLTEEYSEGVRPPKGDKYRMNDHYLTPLCKFAVEKEPRLNGLFHFRSRSPKKKRAIVILDVK
jgi:hypothetical protein